MSNSRASPDSDDDKELDNDSKAILIGETNYDSEFQPDKTKEIFLKRLTYLFGLESNGWPRISAYQSLVVHVIKQLRPVKNEAQFLYMITTGNATTECLSSIKRTELKTLGDIIRFSINKICGYSINMFCETNNMNKAFLSRVLNGKSLPSSQQLDQIARVLGYKNPFYMIKDALERPNERRSSKPAKKVVSRGKKVINESKINKEMKSIIRDMETAENKTPPVQRFSPRISREDIARAIEEDKKKRKGKGEQYE